MADNKNNLTPEELAAKKAAELAAKKAAEEEAKRKADPWEDMVEITLPRHPKNEQNFQFVAVNDRRFQVPRSGKPVKVPRPVYEVLMNAEALRTYSADRKDELAEEYKE